MLPKINSLRSKNIIINSKKILLKPWSNIQLTNFESVYNSEKDEKLKVNIIKEQLIDNNIEYNQNLTLVEERIILTELYKLSKSNIIDVVFTCKKCESKSNATIHLDKVIKTKELSSRIIKTKNAIFNLRQFSIYRINLEEDINLEVIKYLASFIDSVDYDNKQYEGFEFNELVEWLTNELDKQTFDELVKQFDKIQPKIEINAKATCEFCAETQELAFKGVEDFLE